MLIKLLHPYLNKERGDIVEYPKGVADALIQSRKAVMVDERPSVKKISTAPRNKAVAITERK